MMVNFYFNQSIQLIYALNILQFIVHSLGEEDGGGGEEWLNALLFNSPRDNPIQKNLDNAGSLVILSPWYFLANSLLR